MTVLLKKKAALQILAVVLISIALFSALFFLLYRYDNKYTHQSLQPVAGLLVLDEADLANNGAYFLTRDWQLYPDVLLTPAHFAGGAQPSAFSQTVTIGQHSGFTSGDSAVLPTGSATYRLLFHLPEEPRVYTLVLPEIYSAYRLYIGGREMLSVGAPETDGLSEQIGVRTVQFTAGGSTELLLAVTNRTHFYKGLTYPPLFGLPDAVGRMQSTRLLIGMTALLLAGVCTVLALYLYLAMLGKREKKVLLYFCTALCVAVSYLYPVLFTYATVPPKPWYGIELAAIYGAYFFVVLLQNQICGMDWLAKAISSYVLGGFCVLALLYGLIPIYPSWLIAVFGTLCTLIKALTALYLIYCSVKAALTEKEGSRVLLFCTTAFGVSILCDRIFPRFEPIYFGWMVEYGSAVMVLGLGAVLWRDISEGYRLRLAFAEEKRQLTRQLTMQTEYAKQFTRHNEEMKTLTHDFRQHLRTMMGFAAKLEVDEGGQGKEMLLYLNQVAQSVSVTPSLSPKLYCENTAVDALLQYYAALAMEDGIVVDFHLSVPGALPLTDMELCSVLGNLLENAIEGCRRVPEDARRIDIRTSRTDHLWFFCMDNSYDGKVQKKGDAFLSRKTGEPRLGVGLQSVQAVVESHRGTVSIYPLEDVFRVGISLPSAVPTTTPRS